MVGNASFPLMLKHTLRGL